MIYRLYVHKKKGFNTAENALRRDIESMLGIFLPDLKEFLRYDAEGMTKKDLSVAARAVFSEPQSDELYYEKLPALKGYKIFASEYLPGQYDQRADSCEQCVQLLTQKERPVVRCARVFALQGATDAETERVKRYLINPVEAREASLEKPDTLFIRPEVPAAPPVIAGFKDFSDAEVEEYHKGANQAMSAADLKLVRDYFKAEGRDPVSTELKILDTYWSDHCRHTTFTTELTAIDVRSDNPHIAAAERAYRKLRDELYGERGDKVPCLMDIATIAAKKLKKNGFLPDLDESDEINACSIKIKADVGGRREDWLIMFKNETHNHPTEIEPFGGAATCLGGAIRDPLSGRAYVYQAMRVTGAADPRAPFDKTLKGKLPQRALTRTAAAGFSSYGNQIGLSTGLVREYYHPNFAAKRLEAGFVIGAAPAANVVRAAPEAGDVVVLLGGDTGRDGCGGATGSSKAHDLKSIETCGAEVQKGNPVTERKIQRLFRNPAASRPVKRCNDFGAGGVCVAIGELADGVDIDLDAVPKKYDGLSATELAISESQERMAVVLAEKDADAFIALAAEENLNAAVVARVTSQNALRMFWRGRTVADLKRTLLNSAGARQRARARITDGRTDYVMRPQGGTEEFVRRGDLVGALLNSITRLDVCGQKGLISRFDFNIGAGSVFAPLGGAGQNTPCDVMGALLPSEEGEARTATVCSHGFDPYLMSASPFLGAVYSVVLSVVRLILAGVPYGSVRLSFQEYFGRVRDDPDRWGLPVSALLGAMTAQLQLGVGAIGGKDSMSGSFGDMDVPPTLISFSAGATNPNGLITNAFKGGRDIYLLPLKRDAYGMPDFVYLKRLLYSVGAAIMNGTVRAAQCVGAGGAAAAAVKACLGNGAGLEFADGIPPALLFNEALGDIILAVRAGTPLRGLEIFASVKLGRTTDGADGEKPAFAMGGFKIPVEDVLREYDAVLDNVFPAYGEDAGARAPAAADAPAAAYDAPKPALISAKPRVFIPVFPGTNSEYDTARAFREAGAEPVVYVLRNGNSAQIAESAKKTAEFIDNSQILALAGGFSGGDEPDGSGKFITAFLRNPYVSDAVARLLGRRNLILGICNGFQALVKSGLLPDGEIKVPDGDAPTLTFNAVGRHVAAIAEIKVVSVNSPWLSRCKTGEKYLVPVSHGEGRFTAGEDNLKFLFKNGRVATVYEGYNPNGSAYGIEGVTGANGLIFGKMGHTERTGRALYKNVAGNYAMPIFAAGAYYFK